MASGSVEESQPIKAEAPKKSRLITVEPIAFIYLWASNWATHINMQYTGSYFAENVGGNPELLEGSCGEKTNDTNEVLASVIAAEGQYTTNFMVINLLPMALVVLFLGSYSDSRGRKMAMLLPLLGGILRAIVAILVVYYNVDINYTFIGAAVEGLTGGSALMVTGFFAYIADISSRERRSWRFLMVLVACLVGVYLSKITLGYLVMGAGYMNSFVAVLVLYVICGLAVVFGIRETVSGKDAIPLISCEHFLRTFRPLCRQAEGGRATVMKFAFVIVLLSYFGVVGLWNIGLYLYVGAAPFCYSWQQIGALVGVSAAANFVLGIPVFRLAQTRLRDGGLLVLAVLDGLICQVYLAVPVMTNVYVFLAPVIGFLSYTSVPIARAMMSVSAGVGEQGAVQALAGLCLVLTELTSFVGGSAIFAMVTDYTPILFALAAGISAFMLLVAGALLATLRREGYQSLYEQL